MEEERESTRLLLVRHGHARSSDGTYGPDTPLSDLGRRQAIAIARSMRARTPRALYTSPFPRASQTAEPLSRELGIEPISEPRLAEFVADPNPGPVAEVLSNAHLLNWRPDHRPHPEGETLREFSTRVGAFLEEAALTHTGACIALFAHAGTIDAAVRWAVGLPPESAWQHEFDVKNASITEVVFWPGGRVATGAPRYAVIERVADTSHLPPDLASDD